MLPGLVFDNALRKKESLRPWPEGLSLRTVRSQPVILKAVSSLSPTEAYRLESVALIVNLLSLLHRY